MPLYIPYVLLFTSLLLSVVFCIRYLKVSNPYKKAVVTISISFIGSVLITNISLALFSKRIGPGGSAANNNQQSFLLACGRVDVVAIQTNSGMNPGDKPLTDISINVNKIVLNQENVPTQGGFSTIGSADVHYSFSDFDFFADVVISTATKDVVIYGSNGHISSE